MSVERAFTSGATPLLMLCQTLSGYVMVWPLTKKLTTTSSMERVNDSRAPPAMPGASMGSVTRKNVSSLLAPRSIDASSSDWS